MMFICWILAAAGISFKAKRGESEDRVRGENLFQASRFKRKFTALVESPSKQFVTAPRSRLWSWGCQRLTSHSQTIASVCVTKYRQLKPSTFILYELIVIQGSSTQIMGHREARIMTGSGRGLLGKAHSSLSDACLWSHRWPPAPSLPTGFWKDGPRRRGVLSPGLAPRSVEKPPLPGARGFRPWDSAREGQRSPCPSPPAACHEGTFWASWGCVHLSDALGGQGWGGTRSPSIPGSQVAALGWTDDPVLRNAKGCSPFPLCLQFK